MAIANALQLETARRRAVPIRFNTSPVPSLNSLSLSVDSQMFADYESHMDLVACSKRYFCIVTQVYRTELQTFVCQWRLDVDRNRHL